MVNKLGLTKEEEMNINTICEYLFFDQFKKISTFLRFERCFQPLFSNDQNFDSEFVFKELCGPKKKYLNYKRFVNSYLSYKENKVSEEVKYFFDQLFNSILQKDKTIGSFEEGRLTFSTRKANKNRECITLIEVLNDKEGVIHGINVEFDGIFKNKLYPKKIEEKLSVGLEIALKILDEEKLEKRGISKYMKSSYFRDAVTHIFGTINEETGFITFLGFKCVSGKTQFVGTPKGKSFLIGEFGQKLQQLKCQMTSDGITTLLAYLGKNYRPNYYLSKKVPQLTLNDISKDEIILDEAYLAKLQDKNEIDKFITTTLIDDAQFFNFKLKDNIFGNSLKEVIKKKPKRWMMQGIIKQKRPKIQRNLSLNEFMLLFDEEQKRRGRFFRTQIFGYPGYDPRFALLNRNRMHRRRRLRPFGFEFGGLPYSGFRGQFSRNFHPFRQIPPPMRNLSVPPFSSYFGQNLIKDPANRMYNYQNDYGYQRNYDSYDNMNMRRQNYGNFEGNNIVLRARPDQKKRDLNVENEEYNLQNKNKEEVEKDIEKNEKEEMKDENDLDEDDDEEILIPDEHPEETTTLEELDEKLASIQKLLENKKLKEVQRDKLSKLEKLYSQQKNIFLDNKEEKEKEEMLKKNDIKLDDYLKEEERKRKKVEEKEDKLLEEEIEKNADKKETITISIVTKPNPERIFRKQEMYRGQQPWTDPMFKPCKENLCPYNESGWVLPENVLFTDVDGWEKYNWSRVEEILNSKNYQVFEEGITPDDIIQGSIGDCYFLSAIGSLCKFSHYIDKLFFTKEKTKEHLYGVFIYLNGTWKLVLIDDFLPYTGKKFRKFAFSASGGKELWVAFLEKAWAKINGSYAKIGCGGSPTEVFDILTEAYSEQVQIHPYYKDFIWETMNEAEKKGYIMTAGSSADIYNLNLEEIGLSAGHAYTVLGVMEIKTENGLEKVVRLRNPYGNGEFNGDWSDYSKKWTPELKKKYNLVIKDDGDFYMSFDDFLNYYITLGICKLHPGFKTTSVRMIRPKKCQVIKLTVPKGEILAYLQLYQKNPRVRLKDGTYQKLCYCFLTLVDKDFNYLYSVSNGNMHIGFEQKLKEGTYYLLSDVNYRYANPDKKNHSYVVTCYAETAINLENVTENVDITKMIQNTIYSYCRQYVPPTTCSNGVFLYRTSTNMDSLPFEAAVFENYTDKNYRVKVNVVGKGEKSYCFYEDEIGNENDTSVIKELNINSVVVFSVLKYSLSSVLSLKYFFAPLKSPNPDSITLQKAPKIYPEKSTLKPEPPVQTNEQIISQDPNAQFMPSQDQISQQQNIYNQYDLTQNTKNIESNQQQYLPSQYENMGQQYDTYQNQYIQNNQINNQVIPQQNIQNNDQYINKNNVQHKHFISQDKPKNYYQYLNQNNIQYVSSDNIKKNTKIKSQFIPKTNIKKTTNNIQQLYEQSMPQFTPKTGGMSLAQYYAQNNYIKNNMAYMQQNQNKGMNINYLPYSQNVPEVKVIPKKTTKKTGNPVFQTQGQIIDQEGTLIQYAMINGDNYIIGLENRSNMKVRLQLILKGLVISNTGKSFAIFYSNPMERKIFNAKILPNYNYDQLYFEFQNV